MYQWVIVEAIVLQRIFNDHNALQQDRVGAEGDVARGLAHIEPLAGDHPLPIPVQQGDKRNGHVKGRFCQPGKALQPLIIFFIKQIHHIERF